MWRRDVNDVMHRKRVRRIWGILKKVSWVEFCLGGRRLTFTRSPRPCVGYHTCCGGVADGKANIERLCLSPYVEKPFNSKVIKSFVPELRSRKCFSCFGIPMFYVYMLWTFYVRFPYSYHGYVTINCKSSSRNLIHVFTYPALYLFLYVV